MKTILGLVALSVVAAAPAAAGRFVEASGGRGASVSITDDGCTASVLFDDARVRGPQDLRDEVSVTLPLRLVGGESNVDVEVRGFATGGALASAYLKTRNGDETLFESDFAADPNWSRTLYIPDLRGRLRLDMSLDADEGDAQTELAIDSIDLSIENCGAPSS